MTLWLTLEGGMTGAETQTTLNGYVCLSLADVAMAKKGVNPAATLVEATRRRGRATAPTASAARPS